MILDLIAIGVIIVSLIIIVFIIARKFPVLSAINTNSLPKHRQDKVRDGLIEHRLRRKLTNVKDLTLTLLKPARHSLKLGLRRFYDRLLALEREYRMKAQKEISEEPEDVRIKVDKLLVESKELTEREEFQEAEKKLIEIISIDPKSVDAYKALGELYFRMKDFLHAKEVFRHLLKLDTKDADVYTSLGMIATQEGRLEEAEQDYLQSLSLNNKIAAHHVNLGETYVALGDMKKAIAAFREAVRLEPNNPRNLDVLLTTSINAKDKTLAQETLEKLKQVNPENEKLGEFQKQIQDLS